MHDVVMKMCEGCYGARWGWLILGLFKCSVQLQRVSNKRVLSWSCSANWECLGMGVVMIFYYLSQCSHGGIEGYHENLRQCSIFPIRIQTKYLSYICQMFYHSFTLQLVFPSSGLREIDTVTVYLQSTWHFSHVFICLIMQNFFILSLWVSLIFLKCHVYEEFLTVKVYVICVHLYVRSDLK